LVACISAQVKDRARCINPLSTTYPLDRYFHHFAGMAVLLRTLSRRRLMVVRSSAATLVHSERRLVPIPTASGDDPPA
jgi:hypothetical protein